MVSRLLCRDTDVDSKQTDFHLKEKFQNNFQKPINSSKYMHKILNSYDKYIFYDYLEKVLKELKKESPTTEEYKLREKQVTSFINKLLRKLQEKYKRKLKKGPYMNRKKYQKFLHIVTNQNTKDMLKITIPILAKTNISCKNSLYLVSSYGEAILSELLSLSNSIIHTYNKKFNISEYDN
ncbi:hypothetical protein PMALA_034160 [Plasmodium malariae]|nr:hypothetical protein PMALA_034160 [Plasmodium malariae]